MIPLKRADRSRNLILDAAETVFRQKSYADVSVEEIAQRAGLTRQTVYNLFASKEDIVAQLVIRVEAHHDPAFRVRMAANEAALVILEDALLASARWCLANPTIALLALAGSAGKPSPTPPADHASFQRLVRDLLVLGQRQHAIRNDEDPDIMALVLLGTYAQTMRYTLSDGSFREKKLKYLLRLLVEGIGERQTPASRVRPKRTKRAKPKTASRRLP
jgi:TetR/AcrR family transcriptional regulator of autoinduction and epiphytic fitness